MGTCERCIETRKVDYCPVHRQVLVGGKTALIGLCLSVLRPSAALEKDITVEALIDRQWRLLNIYEIEEVVTGLI